MLLSNRRYCLRQNSELRCIVSLDVQVVTDASAELRASLAKTDSQETVQITEGRAKYSSVDYSTDCTPKRSTVAKILRLFHVKQFCHKLQIKGVVVLVALIGGWTIQVKCRFSAQPIGLRAF